MKKQFRFSMVLVALTSVFSVNAEQTEINTDNALETITVVAPKNNSITISSQQLVTLPGTGNDPIKGLEALPGVILATSNSGGPIAEPAIRGSSYKDNLYLTDNLDMGYVFHNDGLSVYNPLLIESFELKTGAWSPAFTNANGGVILTQLRDADGERAQKVLDLSLFRSGFLYEQGVSQNSAFYLSYRESLVHTYIDNFIEDEEFSFSTPPRNRDYQARYNWQINDQDILRITASGAKDYIAIEFDEDGRDVAKNPDLRSGEQYQTYYHSQAISWQRGAADYDLNLSVNHLLTNQQDKQGDVFSWQAEIDKLIFKTDNTYFGDDYDLQFGAKYQIIEVDSQSAGRLMPCNTEFEMCPPSYFSDTFESEQILDFNEYAVYVNLQSTLFSSLDYQVGAAYIGSDLNDQSYFEPRAALSWQVNDNNQVKLAYGIHHTFVDDYRLLNDVSGNPLLEANKSEHITLSLTHDFGDAWQARFETYYKDFLGLIVANPAAQQTQPGQTIPEGTLAYLDVAEGEAYGAELLINKSFSDNWLGWFSLAYSKTKRTNPLTNESFNSEFDLPWVANLVLDYQFSERWSLGVKWRYQSGRRYTQVNAATPYYEADQNEPLFYVPHYEDFNASSVKDYHRLDLRTDYKTDWFNQDTSVYFEILNVYGSRTIQEFEYTPDYTSYEKDYQFPDMPLPSIGITINF